MTPSQALQRVLVRMHYDPQLVRDIYAGKRPAPLTEAQCAWLIALDRRAYACDPERPLRTLQSLIEETPVSSAIAGIDHLRTYFRSKSFHGAIMQRERLIENFARWLVRPTKDFAWLELAIAKARRHSIHSWTEENHMTTSLCLADHCGVVSVGAGTLERYAQLRQHIGVDIVKAIASSTTLQIPKLAKSREREYIIIQDGNLSKCNQQMYDLLSALETPCSRGVLRNRFCNNDDERAQLDRLFTELKADGLVAQIS